MSIMVNKKRITKSLRTRNYTTAKGLKSLTETTILQELNGFTKSNAKLSFRQLVDRFLKDIICHCFFLFCESELIIFLLSINKIKKG